MTIFTKSKYKTSNKRYPEVLSDCSIKQAAKLSIEDQRKISKQANRLRVQTASQ